MKKSFKSLLAAAVLAGSSMTVIASGDDSKLYSNVPSPADTGSRVRVESSRFSTPTLLHGSLVTFNGAYEKNCFDLSWNTLPEAHYDHFEIERSLDGNNYVKLGEIKGTISKGEGYSYRDNLYRYMARGTDLYYRLKQVDVDGQVSYSKVLIARIYHSRSIRALSVTPDPVANDILVNVQLKESSFVVMKIRDQNGNELLSEGVNADNGLHTYTLKGSGQLKPGSYMLEVIVNSRENLQVRLLKS